MKVETFDRLMAAQVSRRSMLQGAASVGAVAAGVAAGFGGFTRSSFAQSTVRAEILRIPERRPVSS